MIWKNEKTKFILFSMIVVLSSLIIGLLSIKLGTNYHIIPLIWIPSGILTVYYLHYQKNISLFISLITYTILKLFLGIKFFPAVISSIPEIIAMAITIRIIEFFKSKFKNSLHNQTDIIGIPLASILGSLITAIASTYGIKNFGYINDKNISDFFYFSFFAVVLGRLNFILIYREYRRSGFKIEDLYGPICVLIVYPIFKIESFYSAIGLLLIIYLIPILRHRTIGLFLINIAISIAFMALNFEHKGPFEVFTNNNPVASSQIFLISLAVLTISLRSLSKITKTLQGILPSVGILLIASLIFAFYYQAEVKTEQIEIKNIHNQFVNLLNERINIYENNLKAVGSLLKAMPKLKNEQFQHFASSLKLRDNFNEIDSFGLILLDNNRGVVDTLISPAMSDIYLNTILKTNELERLFQINFIQEIPILSKRINLSILDSTVNKSIILLPIIVQDQLIGFSFCILDNDLFFSNLKLANDNYDFEIYEGVGTNIKNQLFQTTTNKTNSRMMEVISAANHVFSISWKKAFKLANYNLNLSFIYFFILMILSSFGIQYIINVRTQNELINEKNELLKSKAQDSEKRYSSIFNATTDAIAIFNNEQIIDYNRPFEKLFSPTVQNEFKSLFTLESQKHIPEYLKNLEEYNHVNFELECIGIESKFFADIKLDKLNVNGQKLYLVTIIDISERKNIEKNLKEARDFALEASKAKSRFLSNMSHEIRTPLNGIIGIINLFLDKDENKNLSNEQYDNLKVAEYSANHLIHILNEILDYSKIESGKIVFENRPLDFKSFIQKLFKMSQIIGEEKDLTVVLDYDENIPNILFFDEVRNAQILNNILSNAIKFTSEGYVSLQLKLKKIENQKAIIEFNIIDTGIGIPSDKIDYIFNEFTQADENHTRKYGGTGLGLSICKKLVELMGGKITVQSKINQGTTISYEITYDIAEQIQIEKTISKEVEVVAFAKKILLVEDNDINLLVAKKYFSKLQLEVDFARDGYEAIDKFRENEYGLIFMDLHMPKLDGILATKEIRKFDSNIPIYVLSADSIGEVQSLIADKTFNGFLQKPFKIGDVINIIKKHS